MYRSLFLDRSALCTEGLQEQSYCFLFCLFQRVAASKYSTKVLLKVTVLGVLHDVAFMAEVLRINCVGYAGRIPFRSDKSLMYLYILYNISIEALKCCVFA